MDNRLKNTNDVLIASSVLMNSFSRAAARQRRIANMEAEGVRFELTRPFGLPVFKTGAINRSATPPELHIGGRKFITQLLHYSK
jgi:hypothetical protein